MKQFKLEIEHKPTGMDIETLGFERKAAKLAEKVFEVLADDENMVSHGARALNFVMVGMLQFEAFKDAYKGSIRLTDVGMRAGFLKISIAKIEEEKT